MMAREQGGWVVLAAGRPEAGEGRGAFGALARTMRSISAHSSVLFLSLFVERFAIAEKEKKRDESDDGNRLNCGARWRPIIFVIDSFLFACPLNLVLSNFVEFSAARKNETKRDAMEEPKEKHWSQGLGRKPPHRTRSDCVQASLFRCGADGWARRFRGDVG